MSGKRYVCRVVREFGSLGPSGLVLHNVGDEVVRDTEPADGVHLEVVRVEDAAAPQAPQLVVNPASEGEAISGDGTGEALPEITADPVTEAQAAPADAAPAEPAPAPAATPARKRAQAAAG